MDVSTITVFTPTKREGWKTVRLVDAADARAAAYLGADAVVDDAFPARRHPSADSPSGSETNPNDRDAGSTESETSRRRRRLRRRVLRDLLVAAPALVFSLYDALRPARAEGDGRRRRTRSRLATDPKPKGDRERDREREARDPAPRGAVGASAGVDSVGSDATVMKVGATEYEVRDGRPVAKPSPAGTRRYAEELQMRNVYGMG